MVCQIVKCDACIHCLDVINCHPCFLAPCVFVKVMPPCPPSALRPRLSNSQHCCPSSNTTPALSISSHHKFSNPAALDEGPCRLTKTVLSWLTVRDAAITHDSHVSLFVFTDAYMCESHWLNLGWPSSISTLEAKYRVALHKPARYHGHTGASVYANCSVPCTLAGKLVG